MPSASSPPTKDAGLTQIDRLIITHWHGDHYGGMAELEKRIPIREYMDHGPNQQPAEAADKFLAEVYPALYAKGKHTVAQGRRQDRDARASTSRSSPRTAKPSRTGRCAAPAGRIPTCAGFVSGSEQRRRPALGRPLHQLRQLPHDPCRRHHQEQGTRPDVPEQSGRHGRPVPRPASRSGHIELAGDRARAGARASAS